MIRVGKVSVLINSKRGTDFKTNNLTQKGETVRFGRSSLQLHINSSIRMRSTHLSTRIARRKTNKFPCAILREAIRMSDFKVDE